MQIRKNSMKRFFVFLLLPILLAVLFVPAAANADNASYGEVNLYTGQLLLDGIKDPQYEQYGLHLETTAFEYVNQQPQPGFSGDYWLLFTNRYRELHIFTEIRDDSLLIPDETRHTSMPRCYHLDSAEVWIDPTNALTGNIFDDDLILSEAFHYRTDPSGFNAGNMWGINVLGNAASKAYFGTKTVVTETGWNAEWIIRTDIFTKTVYEDKPLTTLSQGEKWGLQLMSKNVFNSNHYPYADTTDITIYAMNSFTLPCSREPYAASHNTADFDYIVLGGPVSDEEETTAEENVNEPGEGSGEEQTGKKEEQKENPTDPPSDPHPTRDDPNEDAPPVPTPAGGDAMAIGSAMLMLSAGGVYFIRRRKR